MTDSRTVSPELVLVDPELAAWARARLPERSAPPISAAPPVPTPPPAARRARLAIAATTGLVIVATAVLTVDSDDPRVRVAAAERSTPRVPAAERSTPRVTAADRSTPEDGNEPPGPTGPTKDAATPTSRVGRDASRVPAPGTSARAKKAAIATPARRFVWAPRPGASGYHVELFKGRALIFRAATSKPEIVIPRRWRLNGRTRRLEPGLYRWYVWSRIAGRRESTATVQATFVVPTR